MVESLPANAGDTGLSPGLGRSHMPRSNWACEPQLLSLRVWSSATGEAATVRCPRTAMKSGPRLPQLEKALAQKRRPNTAKNKFKKRTWPLAFVLLLLFFLNIYGFYLTYISTYNIHTGNTSSHHRTFIAYIPSHDISPDFEPCCMKDVQESILHLSPRVAGDRCTHHLRTTCSCTCSTTQSWFSNENKSGFQEPC